MERIFQGCIYQDPPSIQNLGDKAPTSGYFGLDRGWLGGLGGVYMFPEFAEFCFRVFGDEGLGAGVSS